MAIFALPRRRIALQRTQKDHKRVYYSKNFTYLLNLICSGNRSDGHLGCSNGYDGLAYKPYLHDNFNSEGREQVHSLLEKVSSFFRQMNYTSFMHLHRVFFGIRNLKSKGLMK